jgi:hypothetical protein
MNIVRIRSGILHTSDLTWSVPHGIPNPCALLSTLNTSEYFLQNKIDYLIEKRNIRDLSATGLATIAAPSTLRDRNSRTARARIQKESPAW